MADLSKAGKQTGTQVFGPAREDSDIDIILRQDNAEELKIMLEGKGIKTYQNKKQTRYNRPGFYFDLGVMTFNISYAGSDEDMLDWEQATKSLCKLSPIKNREERIENFKKFLRGEK